MLGMLARAEPPPSLEDETALGETLAVRLFGVIDIGTSRGLTPLPSLEDDAMLATVGA